MNRLTRRYEHSTEIAALSESVMERLYTGLFLNERNAIAAVIDKLADYEDAEEQGLLVRLPCKVGDTVYEAQKDGTIQKWYISSFEKYDGITWKASAKDRKNKWRYIERTFSFDSFGETVFLSRKEAEKALKEGDENVY